MIASEQTKHGASTQPPNGTGDRSIRCLAAAKLNLTLAVLGRRPDGYHELESWVVRVRLYDEVVVEPADDLHLEVTPSGIDVPPDKNNLVWKAATGLADAAGVRPLAKMRLAKTIPTGAGLGGGSADAAATLTALNTLWGIGWPAERLTKVAETIGSDVPYCLTEGSALMRGRGETINPLKSCWSGWVALVVPPFSVSTAEVYSAWEGPSSTRRLPRGVHDSRQNAVQLADELFNDLEAPAFAVEPRLETIHRALDGLDGRRLRLTGSGACFFAVFDDPGAARAWGALASERIDGAVEIRIVQTS